MLYILKKHILKSSDEKNYTGRILDGVSKASYYKLQWKNEIKVAKWGTPKNI